MSANPSMPSKDDKITPPAVHFNRRAFIKAGAVAAAVGATGWVYRRINALPPPTIEQPVLAGLEPATRASSEYPPAIVKAFGTDEEKTPFQSITHYNNFYEFSTDKDGVAGAVGSFSTGGWKVIGATKNQRVKLLVYVAALAPDEGQTVAEVFYREPPHAQAPRLAPDEGGFIWMPPEGFEYAFAQDATPDLKAILLSIHPRPEKCTSSGTSPDEKQVAHVYHVLQQPEDVKPWGGRRCE
jgi:hypothetical protein